MKKGQKRREWTAEQKAEIVNKHLKDHISVRTLEKEYHADRSMICKWVKKYIVLFRRCHYRKLNQIASRTGSQPAPCFLTHPKAKDIYNPSFYSNRTP